MSAHTKSNEKEGINSVKAPIIKKSMDCICILNQITSIDSLG